MISMKIRIILETIIYAFILMSAIMYSWFKLSKKTIDFKNKRIYITLLFMMLTSIFNFFIINKYFRIILITIFFMWCYRFLFKEHIQKCVLTPIYSQILVFFAELIYVVVVLSIVGTKNTEIMETTLMTVITNIVVALLLCLLVQIKFVNKLYEGFIKLTNKIKPRTLIILCLFGMLILNVLIMISYYKIKLEYFVLINVCLIGFVIFLIVYSLKTQNNYNTVSDKYNVAKNSLKDYEAMMTKYRIANHENKNMLLTVRAMAVNNEKNIPEYIDSIIKNKFLDDEKLLFEMSVIPEGGLRATIYSEILKIKEHKIDFNLNIDKRISTIDLIELDTNTIIDICKTLGVFIDNSIEAVKKLKQKYINIDLYTIDNILYIKVANNYSGKLDASKINDEGYTTKGKGHGYGLPLVQEIMNSNSHLENETIIDKKVFSQTLKIKYKRITKK